MELEPKAASRAADAVLGALSGGTLELYSREQVKLVALPFGRPAFQPAQAGLARGNPLEKARATGTGAPVRFVALNANGSAELTGSVGRLHSGADIEIEAELISAGAEVLLHTLSYRQPRQG